MILPPTSKISQHHKVTNITMSPTSLSPLIICRLRLNRCWWRMFGMVCVYHESEMLETDNKKVTNITKKITPVWILQPIFQSCHHHKVTNITFSPISRKKKTKSFLQLTVHWHKVFFFYRFIILLIYSYTCMLIIYISTAECSTSYLR